MERKANRIIIRLMSLIVFCICVFVSSFITLTGCSRTAAITPIKIATKPMTEQYILGEMLKQLIESETGYDVEVTKGIAGGTSNIQPAMINGDFDLYPEYTSSGYVLVLDKTAKDVSDDEIWDTLNKEYPEKFDMKWISRYGFNNTYCVVVNGDVARRNNLKTTSDLATIAEELIFGANPDYFERADGFPALKEAYGLNFKDIVQIDIGLRYVALDSGEIDVTNGQTTEAQLAVSDVVVLDDNLNLHANYFCSTVVRNDALKTYPKLEAALNKMDGILSDSEMTKLNYEVSVVKRDEAEVAHEYLVSKGILKVG